MKPSQHTQPVTGFIATCEIHGEYIDVEEAPMGCPECAEDDNPFEEVTQ